MFMPTIFGLTIPKLRRSNPMHKKLLSLAVLSMVVFPSFLLAAAQAPGTIQTIAGNGYQGSTGIGGPATAAELTSPNSVAVDKKGNLFIADLASERIYKLDASTSNLTVFAGTGAGGYSGDGGPAIDATFNHPFGLAFGPAGNLFVSDSRNNVIRKIDVSSGIIETVAGSGFGAGPGDADACSAVTPGLKAKKTVLCNPFGIAVDASGNLYFTNATSQVLKVMESTGIVSVVAGTGSYGYSGDGGPAVSASLSWLPGLALDGQGNIYVADSGNCALREIFASSGTITSVVGAPTSPYSGTCGLSGDGGPASAALISGPYGLSVDAGGNIFLGDSVNNVVRMIAASDRNIYTVAGSYANGQGVYGYSGNGGPAVSATLAYPLGITVDLAGDLYINDNENFVVRQVTRPATAIQ
jgi:hypothetical protein